MNHRVSGGHRSVWLLTDFGIRDAYVGTMKAVIVGISPTTAVYDLTHGITPQSVTEGAFVLETILPYLPDGAVVVAVVDPGVGSSRKALAVRTNKHVFVAPDNGLLTEVLAAHPEAQITALDRVHFWLENLSSTFHGRDLFAPVGGHIAAGVPIESLGEAMNATECIRLPPPILEPLENEEGWRGEVVYSDGFGNCITSIPNAACSDFGTSSMHFSTTSVTGIHRTFSDVEVGETVVYTGSAGRLEIGIRNGNAAEGFQLVPGDIVTLTAPPG